MVMIALSLFLARLLLGKVGAMAMVFNARSAVRARGMGDRATGSFGAHW